MLLKCKINSQYTIVLTFVDCNSSVGVKFRSLADNVI